MITLNGGKFYTIEDLSKEFKSTRQKMNYYVGELLTDDVIELKGQRIITEAGYFKLKDFFEQRKVQQDVVNTLKWELKKEERFFNSLRGNPNLTEFQAKLFMTTMVKIKDLKQKLQEEKAKLIYTSGKGKKRSSNG